MTTQTHNFKACVTINQSYRPIVDEMTLSAPTIHDALEQLLIKTPHIRYYEIKIQHHEEGKSWIYAEYGCFDGTIHIKQCQ